MVSGFIAGNQKTAETWYQTFGLQTFDLDVNQICSLLEKPDVENGEITEIMMCVHLPTTIYFDIIT